MHMIRTALRAASAAVFPLALVVQTLSPGAAAQVGSQPVRYRDPVFPQVNVQRDIQYGQAVNASTQQVEDLLLDLYLPANDTAVLRPALVAVHGGGFVGGSRSNANISRVAENFAKTGYVAVSISYRLTNNPDPNNPTFVTDASHDMKAAVRWLRANAGLLRIDPDRIACAGSSAGAITCLESAYVPGEGNSGNPGFSSEVGAVIDLWGGLSDLTQLEAGEAPVLIVHGTLDSTVEYFNATALKAQADAVGVVAELFPVVGAGHGPWLAYFSIYEVEAIGFVYEHLKLGELAGLSAYVDQPSPGMVTVETHGLPGDFYFMAGAPRRGPTPLPGIGELLLGPAEAITIVALGTFPPGGRITTAGFTSPIPTLLLGRVIHGQALHFGPTEVRWLTNGLTRVL